MTEKITLQNCLELAVATEDAGAKFYTQLSRQFAGNREVADLFALLGKDEEEHKRQFSGLLSHPPEGAALTTAPEKTDYIKAMSISDFFSRRQGPFKDVDKITNRDDALEKAFAFEKATLGFYQAVQDGLGKNPALARVIETEKSHVVRLMKVMITGGKFRSLQDEWA
jgi:rubrerythrin